MTCFVCSYLIEDIGKDELVLCRETKKGTDRQTHWFSSAHFCFPFFDIIIKCPFLFTKWRRKMLSQFGEFFKFLGSWLLSLLWVEGKILGLPCFLKVTWMSSMFEMFPWLFMELRGKNQENGKEFEATGNHRPQAMDSFGEMDTGCSSSE